MEFDSRSVSLAAAAFAAVVALPSLPVRAGANAAIHGREVLWHRGRFAERLPDRNAFLRRRIQALPRQGILDLRPGGTCAKIDGGSLRRA